MSTDWLSEVPTTGSKHLPPDSRYMKALSSQGYSFEAAVADLVDNSIDANAKNVIICFLRDSDRLVSLLVVDDGSGMSAQELDVAMTVGGRRDYGVGALGMFGTGLKSASLSHAASVTVTSKTVDSQMAGRRWTMRQAVEAFRCDIVEPRYAEALMNRFAPPSSAQQGTIVRWDEVKNFPQHGGAAQIDKYLHRTINQLGMHLGLHLHRFLAREGFDIRITVEDASTGDRYIDFRVKPMDPFAYLTSGHPDYPLRFIVDVPSIGPVPMTAHIWSPRSSLAEYRAIGSVMERQGFYFYRHDRLVQAGGWNGYRQPEQHLALARIAVDLPEDSGEVFRLAVKKDGVETDPEFTSALESNCTGGKRTFVRFLEEAEAAYRDARKRTELKRRPVIGPGKGFVPEVKEAIEEELPLLPGEKPITIRWRHLDDGDFFDIDRDDRSIILNREYREVLLGDRRGGLNDTPLLKSLMYLLLHQVFEKEYSGSREKDNLQMWKTVLRSAAEAEIDHAPDDRLQTWHRSLSPAVVSPTDARAVDRADG
jgi:hypothetical protein